MRIRDLEIWRGELKDNTGDGDINLDVLLRLRGLACATEQGVLTDVANY